MTQITGHEKRWGMRFFVFVLSLLVSSAALSAQPILGTVGRDAAGFHLIVNKDQQCPKYTIETKSEEAISGVRKLSPGDNITASGILDSDSCHALIESIDYVGLKKLLGYWYSHAGIFTIRDFNSLSFYPINTKNLENGTLYRTSDPINYRYSVTPSEGNEWVVFLSDRKSTTFATIQFVKQSAVMKLYDSDTGKITKILHLSKWGNLR